MGLDSDFLDQKYPQWYGNMSSYVGNLKKFATNKLSLVLS